MFSPQNASLFYLQKNPRCINPFCVPSCSFQISNLIMNPTEEEKAEARELARYKFQTNTQTPRQTRGARGAATSAEMGRHGREMGRRGKTPHASGSTRWARSGGKSCMMLAHQGANLQRCRFPRQRKNLKFLMRGLIRLKSLNVGPDLLRIS